MPPSKSPSSIPSDFAEQIKTLRGQLGLTQAALAERLGVSYVTVNRWENEQSTPSALGWERLLALAGETDDEPESANSQPGADDATPALDFTASADAIRSLAEGERLSFGHMVNPAFATEISQIDPLPHQRIAVYDHMLKQDRLRFLLADDAGAGKTIMAGLYIREMLSRRLLRRVLIVVPAGLVGNWQRELATLFNLQFRIVQGQDARNTNPFTGHGSDLIIVSVDTLAGAKVFGRLREPDTLPYDLVIFDEAHKLSADRGADLRVRKTDRYKLAEAIAGITDVDEGWRLPWSAHHLLLLTATPHMGKDYPYYALWRLLQPSILTTPEAFQEYPRERRQQHFIRRTKEEMVFLDERPMYPRRVSDTLGYDLTEGEVSEQRLYEETTDYLQFIYNKAKMLNREAARLAMSVFQRRLASSTWALLRSFERRLAKLDGLIANVQEGKLTSEQLVTMQRRLHEDKEFRDVLDTETADEEAATDGREENEAAEDNLLQGVIATSLADLVGEREQVDKLRDLAQRVYDLGHESKFDKLREAATDPEWADEKLIIFTEHKDTLDFLVRRLSGLGYTGQIAQIHGGMHFTERQEQIERFRRSHHDGGARFMVCTDAAAEGVNLQFCWLMINYDVPWNPARLEQRMGRIHRYGQKHDPVIILNLVAPATREGRVLKTLLDKLETIRKELKSDKVFDSIGRMFQDVSIKQYMEMAVVGNADDVARDLGGRLTKEQLEALAEREKSLFGAGGDVKTELPRLRNDLEQETYFRLLPGYVRQFIQNAAPLVGIAIEGDLGGYFTLRAAKRGALDPIFPAIEGYGENRPPAFSIGRPADPRDAIWLHPGEPVFEAIRETVSDRLADAARRGAVFVDPTDEKPYLFHLARIEVVRQADPEIGELAHEETLACRLVGVKQYEGAQINLCPVEHLLLLRGGQGLPPVGQRLAAGASNRVDQARAYLGERVARSMAMERQALLTESLPERERFVNRGFDFREAELAAARAKLTDKARNGNRAAQQHLAEVKQQQRDLAKRRAHALRVMRREPELISPSGITFIAHALVVPSSDPKDLEQHDANVERVAMDLAWAYEESSGAIVKDVHTPALARAAGLRDNPGFDLLSIYPSGEKRSIEVKGRAGVGEVEVSRNEWGRACNLGDEYWLYVVYNCATDSPDLRRIQDPFVNLLTKAKGSVLISPQHVLAASNGEV